MFSRLIIAVLFFALGAGAVYYGLSHHVVVTENGTLSLSKKNMAIAETYVDIRDWSAEDFRAHPAVTQALVDNGHGDLVPLTATGPLRGAVKEAVQGVIDDLLK